MHRSYSPFCRQRNAKTPLSVVYDDKSVLEQMHYSLIMQIMRHNNLGFLLDRPCTGSTFRKLLLGAVLATDMGVHFDFMTEFANLLQGADFPELKRRVLVCQALIKCADISNPVRKVYSPVFHVLTCCRADHTLFRNIGRRR